MARALVGPSVYEKEMRTATYRNAIGHDDSVNDRTPGAKLEVRGRRTMELWRTHYPVSTWDEPYARRGAMWRGDAPDWYWTCQFPRPIPPSRAPGPVTEGSTFNQRIPAVELAPNVFYAPPSRIYDYTSRGNEKSGWICTFEELVPPPFERAVDPGVQYVKVKVRYAGTTELVEGAWLRFQVPIGIFPPEFIADVDDASFITTCSFPVPHCEKYLHATFVTPVDIRHVIAQYQNRGCCVFCCGGGGGRGSSPGRGDGNSASDDRGGGEKKRRRRKRSPSSSSSSSSSSSGSSSSSSGSSSSSSSSR